MRTETLTIRNLSGALVSMYFDELNIIENDLGIALRIPTETKSPTRGESATILLIQAPKSAYPDRRRFLERVESIGKTQLTGWMESSRDEGIVIPQPDLANMWATRVVAQPDDEDES
jgi:hypothetical protein